MVVLRVFCVFLRLIYERLRVFPLNAHAVHLFYSIFFFFHFVRLRFTRWSPWHCFVSTKAIIIIILTENRRQRTTTLTAAMRVNECCYYCYSLFFQKESAVLCRRVHNDRSERKKKKFFVFFFEIFTAAFIERDFGPPNMHWYVERTVAEQFIIVVDTRYVSTSVHTTVG